MFALNITQLAHDPVVTKGFQGIVPGNLQVPFPSVDNSQPVERQQRAHGLQPRDRARTACGDTAGEVVGIVVEPIQGAGGHRMAQAAFFRGLSRLAHEYDVFLGFDEVQTAGGQTGAIFACDQFDLPYPPQAVATAKKFGYGAVYMLDPHAGPGVLDTTWGGSLADMVRFCRE